MVTVGRRRRVVRFVVFVRVMSAMAAMAEYVEERTGKDENIGQVPVDVRPVLGEEEKSCDSEKAEKGNMEAAHREDSTRLRSTAFVATMIEEIDIRRAAISGRSEMPKEG